MEDLRKQFTADDLTAAYWRGYMRGAEEMRPRRAHKAPRDLPRGWWFAFALLISIAMWIFIVIPGAAAIYRALAAAF